ncbi:MULTISPECIES: SGNH/GDSL hydrolase family protein [Moraxella]|uniref:SGNH hydrolase-type esterase domain-containing protein n=1 Tax=Moraxella lacunata TaxID=477 RepID=A0A1B8PV42_MORLA|nr:MULTISPECIES: SGNH/GDSL hydrolase family protein [Moraxella]MBE9579839.1 SGNH/GDSL hydrolase family protein [Moraxella sp. K1664]MBE9589212.1 SGNH/GDSL hydrolase family protein [Moraxella sp. K1630]MBE9591564.1 SGNH/GDSL hydrolase family protein [Moraxella sp. K127]MBE9597467.1 SGNH/GDSL hydrolase family protein [Moraxella sp. K2450]MDH9219960.1 SGNH/GDSL hydrolase family protein [Moraxella lacunata]
MATELFSKKQDYLLAPLYYLQAKKVAKTALRLPEPDGVRIANFNQNCDCHALNIAIFGDSSAAGVGVDSQDDAPFGRIGSLLAKRLQKPIHVQLHATSGHTSFDLLHRLYAMPKLTFDVVIISIGVNDVIKRTSDKAWTDNLQAIITLLTRKFGVSHVIFLSLPPMHLAPSLPTPLNGLIGRRAVALSKILEQICLQNGVHYVQDDFAKSSLNRQTMFAKDGFHPSRATYDVWANTLADYVIKIM